MDKDSGQNADLRNWLLVGLWGLMFATIFGEGLFAFIEGSNKWGVSLTAVGVIGAIYVDRRARQTPIVATRVAIGALVLTWIFLGYDIYSRVTFRSSINASSPTQGAMLSGLIISYGDCLVTIDGKKLVSWEDKYGVAMICGVTEPNADRYQVQSIAVSSLHAFRPEPIQIQVPYSAEMNATIKQVAAKTPVTGPTPAIGQKLMVQFGVWNEIVLFPTGLDLSPIHCLDDVQRYGGIILSRQFPDCTNCSDTLVTTHVAP